MTILLENNNNFIQNYAYIYGNDTASYIGGILLQYD